MKKEGAPKTSRLEKLEKKLIALAKSKDYLKAELSKANVEEEKLREVIGREKEAVSLVGRAQRLREAKK